MMSIETDRYINTLDKALDATTDVSMMLVRLGDDFMLAWIDDNGQWRGVGTWPEDDASFIEDPVVNDDGVTLVTSYTILWDNKDPITTEIQNDNLDQPDTNRLVIEISTSDEVFVNNYEYEIAEILHTIADKVAEGQDEGTVFTSTGNRTGAWSSNGVLPVRRYESPGLSIALDR